MGQTRQHANLCKLIGIEQVIVGVNKMDDPSVNYSEERFNEIKGEVEKMLQKAGYTKSKRSLLFLCLVSREKISLKNPKTSAYKGFNVNLTKEKKVIWSYSCGCP